MEKRSDELGEVKVSNISIKRERKEQMWTELELEKTGIVDQVHFSDIEGVREHKKSSPPVLEFKVNGKWREMPFSSSKTCKEVYNLLKYQFHVFMQNY